MVEYDFLRIIWFPVIGLIKSSQIFSFRICFFIFIFDKMPKIGGRPLGAPKKIPMRPRGKYVYWCKICGCTIKISSLPNEDKKNSKYNRCKNKKCFYQKWLLRFFISVIKGGMTFRGPQFQEMVPRNIRYDAYYMQHIWLFGGPIFVFSGDQSCGKKIFFDEKRRFLYIKYLVHIQRLLDYIWFFWGPKILNSWNSFKER